MQVKLFTIRLDSENLEIDQNSLNDFLETIHFKKSDTHFVDSQCNHWSVLIHYEEVAENQKADVLQEVVLSENEALLFEKLKQWRNQKALELDLPHYMICHNSELKNVAIKKPDTKSSLRKIKGFGEIKAERYSDEIISVVQRS